MPHSTLHNEPDSAHPSQCRLHRLFNPRSTSFHESAPTVPVGPFVTSARGLSRSRSFNADKRSHFSVSKPSKLRNHKTWLPGGQSSRVYPRPPYDRTMPMSCRELNRASRIHTPTSRTVPPAALASRRPYLSGRSSPPSFLDLTDSPEYLSPSAASVTMTSTPHVKRKGRPPPLILRDSFHSTGSHSSTSLSPPNDAKAAPLTPMTPMTPITPVSPRYRMPSEKEQLRRRLLKLQRTLGEQITPELVVQPKPSSSSLSNTGGKSTSAKCHQRGGASLSATFDKFTTTLCNPTAQDSDSLHSNVLKKSPPPTHKRRGSAPVPPSPSFLSQGNYLPEPVVLSPMTLTAFAGSIKSRSRSIISTAPSFQDLLSNDVDDDSSESEDYDTTPISVFNDSSPAVSLFNDLTPPASLFDDSSPPVSPFNHSNPLISPFNHPTPSLSPFKASRPPVSPYSSSPVSFFSDSRTPSPSQYTYGSHSDEVISMLDSVPYLSVSRTGLLSTPGTPGIRRGDRRHGWSGEWNQPHIQVVIEKLRIL